MDEWAYNGITQHVSCPGPAVDNGCAASICTDETCDNGITIVNGTNTTGVCCIDSSWTPLPSTKCADLTFTQTSDCMRTRTETGTIPVTYTPAGCSFSSSTLDCLEVSNCGKSESIIATCTGLKDCNNESVVLSQADCGPSCTNSTNTCPPCSVYAPGSWREVAP